MKELWINNQRIEVAAGTQIALTMATQDLMDPAGKDGDGSNRFSLPASAPNRQALGHANDVGSMEEQPYRKLPARYIQGGEELINGYAFIEEAGETIEVELYGGNRSFFAEIEGKSIRDLNLTPYDHERNNTNILNSFINNDGYIYPIANYNADWNTSSTEFNNRTVIIANLLPAMYFHTILRLIAEEAGYTFIGPRWNDAELQSLLLAADNLKRSDEWIQQHSFRSFKSPAEQWTKGSAPNGWVEGVSHAAMNDYDGTYFTAADTMWINFTATGVVGFLNGQFGTITVDITNATRGVLYASVVFTLSMAEAALVNAGTPINKPYTLTSGEVLVLAGELVYVRITYFNPATTGTQIGTYCVYAGAVFNADAGGEFSYMSTMLMSEVVPDISQKDFVKACMQMLGVIPWTNARQRTVYWGDLAELYANKVRAKDVTQITEYRNRKPISFRLDGFAQVNLFRYKADSSVSETVGFGTMLVDDTRLDLNKTIITLPFAPTTTNTQLLNASGVGLEVPSIPRLVAGRDSKKVEPRVLVLNRRTLNDGAITFWDGNFLNGFFGNWTLQQSSLIPLCYFSYPNRPYNLSWSDLLSRHYNEWQLLLNRVKVVPDQVYINEQDIAAHNPFIPWYNAKDNAYYYVNQVSDFTEGDATEVQLIRL
jgi:hypothetical protein